MSSNGFKPMLRTVENVLTVVVNAAIVVVLATYFLMWAGLAVRHVFAGDFVAAAISIVIFVLPPVALFVRRRMKAAYLARKAMEADIDLDVGSPSP